jgi:NAD(P)-dependent dehydrogenase (short-subunit alcohol dehydrogenase family)
MDLKGKIVVGVGGGSGFGNCVVRLALEEGASVVIGGRNAASLEEAAVELRKVGPDVRWYVVDAAEEVSLRAFSGVIGKFDHLVSTVGGAMGGGFATTDIQQIRETVEHKVFDNLRLAQIMTGNINEGGSITFTGGTGGRPHTASGAFLGNAGILTLAEGLASELAPKIRINVVAPTWTETSFWREMPKEQREAIKKNFSQLIPLGRTATLLEVASAYIFLMKNGFITGQQIAVDGGVMLRM